MPRDGSDPQAMSHPQATPDDPASEEAADDPARDCGDFADHCGSGFTFFRRDTQIRSTADQTDGASESVYIVYDATKPNTLTPTGSTYSSAGAGMGGQSAIYFVRYNGSNGSSTAPALLDAQTRGNQVFPDISADGGVLHAIWWDSRNDACYSLVRPIGNCADGHTVPSLDVFGTSSANHGQTWAGSTRITDVTSNPNYEQFDNRAVPFAGDYLWVTSVGTFAYTTWTDWRNTVQGIDPREAPEDTDLATSDVKQCRELVTTTGKKGVTTTAWSGDLCPRDGGLDQDVYGDLAP